MAQITYIEMSVENWCNLPEHPNHNNTDTNVKNSYRLKEYNDIQSCVHAVSLKCVMYILDGHSRAYLWKHKRLKPPNILHVFVHTCKTEKELLDLYWTIDNRVDPNNLPIPMIDFPTEIEPKTIITDFRLNIK